METKCLVVVSGSEQTEQELRLISLATFWGISTRPVVLRDGERIGQHLLDELKAQAGGLAMTAKILVAVHKALHKSANAESFLHGLTTNLLVFDCGGSEEEIAAISWLIRRELSRVTKAEGPDLTISFPQHAKAYSRQLAGLSYPRRSAEPISVFAFRDRISDQSVIVAANGQPVFAWVPVGAMQVFLLGGTALPDLDERVSREVELKEHYERLMPALMFLRHSFGEYCWHSHRPTARLMIDDPLLKPRYGFLDYRVLLNSMQRKNCGTSIAFIPWNCWRTSKQDVERLLGHKHFSICIHGCDHANKEFDAQDSALLRRKAALGLHRLESLRRRTGAEFEPVMVFPQERYSKAAIAALRGQPYLAIVNTICFPTDCEPDDLRIRDFLMPAITRYHGFPIFQRRYPRRLVDSAVDLFLGKPALLVAHHDYFRNGVAPLEEFVDALQRIEPGLTWPDLASQLEESCLSRRLPDGSAEVRFFTRRFKLLPRDGDTGRYLLSKHEPEQKRIEAVLVDGKATQFGFDGELLNLELSAESGQVRGIEIVDRRDGDEPVKGFGIRHNACVFARRALSEFRDNTLSRHTRLRRGAQWVADKMNVTGAGYDDMERYETDDRDCSPTSD